MKENKRKKHNILRPILIVFISIVFGFGMYGILARGVGANQMPMPFGVGMGIVSSGSMEPELSVGDVIVVRARHSYELGDVVVFQSNGILVVHKIIGIDGDMITTKGTANNIADDPIKIQDIKGEVWFTLQGVGGFVNFIKSPMATVILLTISVLLLILSYHKEDGEKKAENDELERIKAEIKRIREENKGEAEKRKEKEP